MTRSDIAACFGPRGPLARALPGYEPRPQQQAMAEAVGAALGSGAHLLVEAGTGIGKSLAYLVPAILWATAGEDGDLTAQDDSGRRRVIVSTYTRALQEQLARKDLPLLERALEPYGVRVRHSLLMGSENYLCVQRLEQSRLQAELPGTAGARRLAPLVSYAASAVSGLRSEIPFPVTEALWAMVRRDRDVCLGPRGPFWEQCLYRRDLTRAREADLLVVNHALYFLDLAMGGRILPPHSAVILDEAHRVEEAAAAQFGVTLGPASIARLLRDLPAGAGAGARRTGLRAHRAGARSAPPGRAPGPGTGREIGQAARAVEEAAARFFSEAARIAPPGRARSEQGGWSARLPASAFASEQLRPPLRELESALLDAAGTSADSAGEQTLAALALRARDLHDRVDLFIGRRLADAVYWVDGRGRDTEGATLHAAPIEVAPILRQRLFESGRTVVLTSATLQAGGSFAYLRSHLGLTAATETALGSPYDYGRQALLYIPETMPDPSADGPGFARAVTAHCRGLVTASDGGALLLFTSYALLNQVHESLQGDPALGGMPLFRHVPDGTATSLLEEFRRARRGVLLGTLTFWQGVDVPGDALRCVVITRLPFEVPDHPAAEARRDLVRARGGDPFLEESLPEAILTFRQGFGRLIRSHQDRGVVAILDPRLHSRGYGAAFLESIPACRSSSSLQEVAAFFAAGSRS